MELDTQDPKAVAEEFGRDVDEVLEDAERIVALFKAAPRDAAGEPDLEWIAAQVGVDEAELRDVAVALQSAGR